VKNNELRKLALPLKTHVGRDDNYESTWLGLIKSPTTLTIEIVLVLNPSL